MSRKTYTLSAVAMAATASLSFSSADGAEAFAQDTAEVAVSGETETAAEELVEVVPEPTVFVSEEVVQPIAEDGDNQDSADMTEASSLRELVGMVDAPDTLSEQMRCLAGAVYFESRGEPLAGQLAVAQVVINRAEDRRFPASYCGVVYQRAHQDRLGGVGTCEGHREDRTRWHVGFGSGRRRVLPRDLCAPEVELS